MPISTGYSDPPSEQEVCQPNCAQLAARRAGLSICAETSHTHGSSHRQHLGGSPGALTAKMDMSLGASGLTSDTPERFNTGGSALPQCSRAVHAGHGRWLLALVVAGI